MEKPKRLFRYRTTGDAAQDAEMKRLTAAAESKRQWLAENEANIRMMRQAAIAGGIPEGDVLVLVLHLDDPCARRIYGELTSAVTFEELNPAAGEEYTIKIIPFLYSEARDLLSPNHRNVFDQARMGDTRVALLAGGRTMAVILPGDRSLGEMVPFHVVQTEADRKAGCTEIPAEFLDRLFPDGGRRD
jgi:hypothetical protein